MITVHKFPIQMSELFWLKLPMGAEVIHVGVQHGQPMMWIRLDTSLAIRETLFGVFGTGQQMDTPDPHYSIDTNPMANAPHLGSFMLNEGYLVFHLFGCIYSDWKYQSFLT